MRAIRKIFSVILIFAMGLSMIQTTEVSAAEQTYDVVKSMHIHPKEERRLTIKFNNEGERIVGLKTSSKNLCAKVTRIEDSSYQNYERHEAQISVVALKNGEYSFQFDIINQEGEKISSHTVKAIVNEKYAVKKASFAGEKIKRRSRINVTDKKSGKLSVVMNKGYSLKRIELISNGNAEGKQVKNHSKITLGNESYMYESNYDGIYNLDSSIAAGSDIVIYYKDKYSNEIESETYTIVRAAQ